MLLRFWEKVKDLAEYILQAQKEAIVADPYYYLK